MTKRKSSIFTVIESVPNWFSARQEDDLIPVATEVTSATVTKSSLELGTPVQGVPPPWQPRLTTGQLPVRLRGCWAKGPRGLSTGIGHEKQRLRLATPGLTKGSLSRLMWWAQGFGLVNGPGPLDVEEGLETESSTHRAFWALLKAAGYEVW